MNRTGLTAGAYTVIITDANGCENTVSATVGGGCDEGCDEPVVSVTASEDANCGEDNGTILLAVEGNLLDFTYSWTPNVSNTNSASGLAAGTYTVVTARLSDATCNTITEIVIGGSEALDAKEVILSQPTCGESNGSVEIIVETGGSGSYTYDWGDGFTSAVRTNMSAGTYTVQVTDTNTNCTDIVTFTLVDDVAGAIVAASDITVTCDEPLGTADYNIAYEDGFATPATIIIRDANGATVTDGNLTAGNYCVVVTDATGCTAGEGCFTVNDSGTINLSATTTPSGCEPSGTITLNVSGGNGNYTYLWNDGNTDASRTGLTPGTYSVTVMDTDGCATSEEGVIIGSDCNTGECTEAPVVTSISATDAECGEDNGSTTLVYQT